MTELETHHFANTKEIADSDKDHEHMCKTTGWNVAAKQYIYTVSPHRFLFTAKGKLHLYPRESWQFGTTWACVS